MCVRCMDILSASFRTWIPREPTCFLHWSIAYSDGIHLSSCSYIEKVRRQFANECHMHPVHEPPLKLSYSVPDVVVQRGAEVVLEARRYGPLNCTDIAFPYSTLLICNFVVDVSL